MFNIDLDITMAPSLGEGIARTKERDNNPKERSKMKSAQKRKPAKAKSQRSNLKDLRPSKDAKGGAQKKEGADLLANASVPS